MRGFSSTAGEVERFIHEEVFGGVSNAHIIGDRHVAADGDRGRCRSPCIYEHEREKVKIIGYRIKPMRFTSLVRLQRDLHRGLPSPTTEPGVYDVYMVSRPDIIARGLTRSLHHWSVYCNGSFYHLTAPSESSGRGNGSRAPLSSGQAGDPVLTALKIECLADPEAPAFLARLRDPGKPLLAYHIGQTEYGPADIKLIAEWIIKGLSHYDFFASNCQHFALCLLVRILNHRRKRRTFLGTALQIAEWDRHGAHGQASDVFQSAFSVGFELVRAEDQRTYDYHRWQLNWKTDLDAHQLAVLWNQGQQGLIPANALNYSRWRRQLCFPFFTNTFPKCRRWLMPSRDCQ